MNTTFDLDNIDSIINLDDDDLFDLLDQITYEMTPSSAISDLRRIQDVSAEYADPINKQTKRLELIEARLADWMGAPDWDTLSTMLLSSYPELSE